jgi:hypothetical protein
MTMRAGRSQVKASALAACAMLCATSVECFASAPYGKFEELARKYHYFQSLRDPSFDFEGFRREVEAIVNSEDVE